MSDEPEEDDAGLTQAQVQARDKAWELMVEHFEGVVLIFDTEVNEGTDRAFACNYHGGLTMGIGLCERGKLDLKARSRNPEV
jgi:hypothetical protein